MKHEHRALTSFGKNVKRQREAKGLTQEKLAEKSELDPTYISGIERGVCHITNSPIDITPCGC
ncbi:MAG: helix-turn-helix transcriptional regulator [Prosthecobacter sp.]|nr:helix-turn-helix transcriptional regulator [Prosthecobacter sp.]HBJ85791.1 transcriptional regulator [Verrucomicrobiales bacterium]